MTTPLIWLVATLFLIIWALHPRIAMRPNFYSQLSSLINFFIFTLVTPSSSFKSFTIFLGTSFYVLTITVAC